MLSFEGMYPSDLICFLVEGSLLAGTEPGPTKGVWLARLLLMVDQMKGIYFC